MKSADERAEPVGEQQQQQKQQLDLPPSSPSSNGRLWKEGLDQAMAWCRRQRLACAECLARAQQRRQQLLEACEQHLGPLHRSRVGQALERRLAEWREGWRRVLAIYPEEKRQPQSLEWRLLKLGFCTAFAVGFFVSIPFSLSESNRRFELYAKGKEFGAVGYRHLRKHRSVQWHLLRHATPRGVLVAFVICSVVGLTLVATAFRDRYSLLYFPLSTVTLLSTLVVVKGLGLNGLKVAMGLTVSTSLLLTAFTLAATRLAGAASVADAYRHFQALNWEEERQKWEGKAELQRYTRSRGHSGPFWWVRRAMEQEKRLGTWRGARQEEQMELELLGFAAAHDDLVEEEEEEGKSDAENEGKEEKNTDGEEKEEESARGEETTTKEGRRRGGRERIDARERQNGRNL